MPQRFTATQRVATIHKRLGKKVQSHSDIDEPMFNGTTSHAQHSVGRNPFRSNNASESVTSQSLKRTANASGSMSMVKVKVEVPSRSPTPSLSPTPSPNRSQCSTQNGGSPSPRKTNALKRKLSTQSDDTDGDDIECKKSKIRDDNSALGKKKSYLMKKKTPKMFLKPINTSN